MLHLELALGIGGEDRVDQRGGRRAVGQLCHREQVLRLLLDLRANLHLPAALTVIVLGKISDATGGEVWEEPETFALEMFEPACPQPAG